jgi:ferredoxin like protein
VHPLTATDTIRDRVGLERKLSINAYNVDPQRAHIWIIDPQRCLECSRQQCIHCCPAACYAPNEDGGVLFSYEGCVECGSCRIVCNELDNVGWTYPTGGFGIHYRYG